MSLPPPSAGLTLDQAPPLAIPASFFALAPVALAPGGAPTFAAPGGLPLARALPATVAATRLATLLFLAAIMFGALYQMIPVVAGAPVPAVRVAHAVHAALALGALGLVLGFATGLAPLTLFALQALLGALLAFLLPTAFALHRAPARTPTVAGMKLALAGLALALTLGALLAGGRATGVFTADWDAWVAAHASLGLVVWVGGLIAAVSWQILPMFYLTAPFPAWATRLTLAALAATLLAVPTAPAAGASREAVVLAAAPGAAAVWLLHPAVALRLLLGRRRRRVDESLPFWLAGLSLAPLTLAAAALAWADDGLGWALAFGWLALWGWSGLIAHGMLTRIVPFLVWFHRFSPRVGLEVVPPMRALWPQGRVRAGFALHLVGALAGTAAALTAEPLLAQLAGLALLAAAVVLGVSLGLALRRRPSGPPPAMTAWGKG